MTNYRTRLEQYETLVDFLYGALSGAVGVRPIQDSPGYEEGFQLGLKLGAEHKNSLLEVLDKVKKQRTELLDEMAAEFEHF